LVGENDWRVKPSRCHSPLRQPAETALRIGRAER
jgi:hypothetical protein